MSFTDPIGNVAEDSHVCGGKFDTLLYFTKPGSGLDRIETRLKIPDHPYWISTFLAPLPLPPDRHGKTHKVHDKAQFHAYPFACVASLMVRGLGYCLNTYTLVRVINTTGYC